MNAMCYNPTEVNIMAILIERNMEKKLKKLQQPFWVEDKNEFGITTYSAYIACGKSGVRMSANSRLNLLFVCAVMISGPQWKNIN